MLRAENVSYSVGSPRVEGSPVSVSRAGVSPVGEAPVRETPVGGVPVLRGVDLHIRPGAFVGVVGPNGAGKTTLMRVLAGILPPSSGQVLFEGRPVHGLPERERARSIAFMSQNPGIGFGFTVQDVVAMGRYAHRPPWWRRAIPGRDRSAARGSGNPAVSRADRSVLDDAVVAEAMAATEVSHLRRRLVSTLSGGERQRVFLARTLAQQPRLLFLDEPTSDLDIRFQLEVLDLVRRLHREQNLTVVMAIHDLTWALRCCDTIVALRAGRVAAVGPAPEVLTESLISDVFGVEARVEPTSAGGPRIDFVGRSAG